MAAIASATASHVARSSQAGAVGAPAPVVEWVQTGAADRDVALPVAPGAAEAVGDQHGRLGARELAQARTQAPGRGVGVTGQHDQSVGTGGVGGVHPGVGADEAVVGAADQHPIGGAQDLLRLVEYDLDGPRVLALLNGEPVGPRGGFDIRERHDGALGLGDDLVRDRQNLPVA